MSSKGLAQSGPSAKIMRAVSRSVVQIHPHGCGLRGSGFVWGNQQQVVTALHVVAGCETLFVLVDGVEIPAKPIHELLSADLALLQLQKGVSVPQLVEAASAPEATEVLEAVGYSSTAPTISNTQLIVRIGSTRLWEMLPKETADILKRGRVPDLQTQIIRAEGHLVPGLSGAPIINSAGQVVGIGSGGLESGAVAVSWAISARYLKNLLAAPPRESVETAILRNLFGTSDAWDRHDEHRCGQLDFVRARESTLGALLKTSDDPTGFLKFSENAAIPLEQLLTLKVDVYEELSSGASVPVPAGSILVPVYGMCRLTLPNGNLAMWITSSKVSSPDDAARVTVGWEEQWLQTVQTLHWTANAATTDAKVVERNSDGMELRRKDMTGRDGPIEVAKAFEKLIKRGDTEVGVLVMRTSGSDLDPGSLQRCNMMPALPTCEALNSEYRFLSAAVSGAYMATFPPV